MRWTGRMTARRLASEATIGGAWHWTTARRAGTGEHHVDGGLPGPAAGPEPTPTAPASSPPGPPTPAASPPPAPSGPSPARCPDTGCLAANPSSRRVRPEPPRRRLVPGRAASPGASPSPSPFPIALKRPGLLAVERDGRILTLDPDDARSMRTIVSGPDNSRPRWSPDGQTLLFLRGRGPAAELSTIPSALRLAPPPDREPPARARRLLVTTRRPSRLRSAALGRPAPLRGPGRAGGGLAARSR